MLAAVKGLLRILFQRPFRPRWKENDGRYVEENEWTRKWNPVNPDCAPKLVDHAREKYKEAQELFSRLEDRSYRMLEIVGAAVAIEMTLVTTLPAARSGWIAASLSVLGAAALILAFAVVPQWRQTRFTVDQFALYCDKHRDPLEQDVYEAVVLHRQIEAQRVVSEWLADRLTLATWLLGMAIALLAPQAIQLARATC